MNFVFTKAEFSFPHPFLVSFHGNYHAPRVTKVRKVSHTLILQTSSSCWRSYSGHVRELCSSSIHSEKNLFTLINGLFKSVTSKRACGAYFRLSVRYSHAMLFLIFCSIFIFQNFKYGWCLGRGFFCKLLKFYWHMSIFVQNIRMPCLYKICPDI